MHFMLCGPFRYRSFDHGVPCENASRNAYYELVLSDTPKLRVEWVQKQSTVRYKRHIWEKT